MLDPFRPEKAEDVERLHRLQAEIHDGFKDWVRERRAGKLKGDEAALFSGEFWTGKRGLELGLVDGLGELRATLQARYGAKVHLPVIGPRRRLLSRFGLGTSVGGTGIDGIGPATLAAHRRAPALATFWTIGTAAMKLSAPCIPTTWPPFAPGSRRCPSTAAPSTTKARGRSSPRT